MSRIKMIALTFVLTTLGVVGVLARRSQAAAFEDCRLHCDIQATACHQNCTTTACHSGCDSTYSVCVNGCRNACINCKNTCGVQSSSCHSGCTTTACHNACNSRYSSCVSACGGC
jgi:hypothetical protein